MIAKLNEQYCDEGIKLGIELANMRMTEGGNEFEMHREEQRKMIERLSKVNPTMSKEMKSMGDKNVEEVVVKELVEYQMELEEKVNESNKIKCVMEELYQLKHKENE